jgi:excisionase family DNA binding protein
MSDAAVNPIAPILVDVDTAAGMLSVSSSTVQRLIESGTLVNVTLDGETRLPVEALRTYVDELLVQQYMSPGSTVADAYGAIESMARERREALEDGTPSAPAGGQYL